MVNFPIAPTFQQMRQDALRLLVCDECLLSQAKDYR